MKVKFKKIRENAKLPTKAHDDDFCYDVYACACEEVAPNVYVYPLGFALQIESDEDAAIAHFIEDGENGGYTFCGWEDTLLSIDFRPRSSVWKTGMVLCNSCGTVK